MMKRFYLAFPLFLGLLIVLAYVPFDNSKETAKRNKFEFKKISERVPLTERTELKEIPSTNSSIASLGR